MSIRYVLAIAAALALAACDKTRDADAHTRTVSSKDPEARTAKSGTSGASVDVKGDTLLQRADQGRIMGNPAANVWMIIVSDFQCPYCRQFHEQNAAILRKEYVQTGKVRMAYINLPLSMHPHAWPAAERAMCSAAQGKFWPVHDAMFASQARWEGLDSAGVRVFFDSLAVAAGADKEQLRACVDSRRVRALIQADYDRSAQSGVQSTPTVIIGNAQLPGVQPIGNYRQALDAALKDANARLPVKKNGA